MTLIIRLFIIFLLLYTAAIIGIELNSGQDHVRHYVGDIDGEVLFYGINTSFCTILLSVTAYIFYMCNVENRRLGSEFSRWNIFYSSQALIFLYLAMDERFMLHERIGFVLGIHDAIILLAVAAFELYLLLKFKQLVNKKARETKYLIVGGLLFALMLGIDVFGPSRGVLRLSLEDLSKLWAIFFLFLYAHSSYLKLLSNRSGDSTI